MPYSIQRGSPCSPYYLRPFRPFFSTFVWVFNFFGILRRPRHAAHARRMISACASTLTQSCALHPRRSFQPRTDQWRFIHCFIVSSHFPIHLRLPLNWRAPVFNAPCVVPETRPVVWLTSDGILRPDSSWPGSSILPKAAHRMCSYYVYAYGRKAKTFLNLANTVPHTI